MALSTMQAEVADLLAHGAEDGCLQLSEVERLAEELDLDGIEIETLYAEIDQRQIALRDDCESGVETTEDVSERKALLRRLSYKD